MRAAVLTLLAVVPAALAAPISVRLETELLVTNPASEIFVCCSDPDQKVVNETVLVRSFSGGPAGSSAFGHVDMTAGIIKHRSAGEQSFTTGTFTGRTRASTDIPSATF